MRNKTNIGLVEYVKAQLGKPYWYGTYGQTATEELYNSKAEQYKKTGYYTKWDDYPTQYGQRVHDCSGLIDGYIMSDTPTSKPVYNKAYDYSANGLLTASKEKGTIDTIPELEGVCVFYDGHVGVYVGNGYVIEARGHKYGVVKTRLKDRPWKHWGKHPLIEYLEPEKVIETKEVDTVTIDLPVLKKGMKNIEAIKTLQRLLKSYSYKGKDGKPLEIDGSFGGNTQYAVREYQADEKLKVDGIVGKDTWTALLIK